MMLVPSLRWFLATTVLCSVVSTTPTRFIKKSIPLESESKILHYTHNSHHAKRQQQLQLGLEGYLPACAVDPSYAVGLSQFKDGDGKLFHKGCENQYKENDPGHC